MKAWNLTAGVVLAVTAATTEAETTIGRWCDRQFNHRIMTIAVANDGQIVIRSKFGDGSSHVAELRKRPGNVFEKIRSAHGDKYRIVPGTGDLQLLDDKGLIRVAYRLENTARHGECR